MTKKTIALFAIEVVHFALHSATANGRERKKAAATNEEIRICLCECVECQQQWQRKKLRDDVTSYQLIGHTHRMCARLICAHTHERIANERKRERVSERTNEMG